MSNGSLLCNFFYFNLKYVEKDNIIMGLFSKLKDLITRKKSISSKIKEKNSDAQLVEEKKFDAGLRKSSSSLNDIVNSIAKKYIKVDEELIDNLKEYFIKFDIGIQATNKIVDAIIDEIKYQNTSDIKLIKSIIVDKLFVYYIQNTQVDTSLNLSSNKNNVILVSGVNGAGKTTSIAKLINFFQKQNKKVLVAAADTFRAGAVEQLEIWAKRFNIDIVKPKTVGQDPASVIYEALDKSKNGDYDVILCDTSGRLQNKVNLMNELKKIYNLIKKFDINQPCESLLVIDATTGQNGILQAKAFKEVSEITGIILTKMDSTSKGGIVLSIKDALNIPVKFIGVGEGQNDLIEFDLENFIHGLINEIEL